MKWIKVKVNYDSDDIFMAKELISNLFYDFGIQGIELEEPMEKNPLDYYHNEKILFSNNYSVSAYFPDNDYLEDKKNLFKERIEIISKENNFIYDISYNDVFEKDWENSWKKYFFPEKISETIVVKPTWQDYEKQDNEKIIEIDPGMAFGTGTHPTTYLCINMLEKYMENNYDVLDIGTGSGILMIAAKKLGANEIWGTDIDEVAVDVAKRNLDLNKIDENSYKVLKGNLAQVIKNKKFDIIVSNILAEIILELLDEIKDLLKEESIVIF